MNRDMRYDGRNPYGSRGGYVSSRRPMRGRRGDRGMDYDMGDMRRGRRRDYAGDMRDYRGDRGDMGDYRQDGHYEPVEFMGYCNGYYGEPQEDYGDMARGGRGRGRGRDRGDMGDYGDYRDSRRDYARYDGRDYGRDYGDYGDYDYYGDYGETLSDEELEKWGKKLKGELNEQERQMFSKENISQRAKQMGRPMGNFGEKELEVATLMAYTDNKQDIPNNIDMAIKMAFNFLNDKDASVKGAEKLAVYYDSIVEGE